MNMNTNPILPAHLCEQELEPDHKSLPHTRKREQGLCDQNWCPYIFKIGSRCG